MKNIKNNKLIGLLLSAVFIFSGCETMDLNGLKNDNEVGLNLNDPVYGFNYVQVALPDFIDNANGLTQQLTRQYAMTGGKTYNNSFQPVNSNSTWGSGYKILTTIKGYEEKAKFKKQYELIGASKIIRAYVMFTLVDLFGDIPYTEAFLGNENLNPIFDKDISVYKAALKELDEALVYLDLAGNTSTASDLAYDLYYGTGAEKLINKSNWKTLANTLKFRAFVTARKNGASLGVNISDELTTLMAGNLIDTPAEDFAFKYGIDNTTFPLSSRHPAYNVAYISGITPPYINNYMMWTMVREKPTLTGSADGNLKDPRVPYYFYTQTADASGLGPVIFPNKFTPRPDHFNDAEYASFYRQNRLSPFVYVRLSTSVLTSQWFGSDHGNDSGRPQDGDKITVIGVYPAGGKYGAGAAAQTAAGTLGQKGAGLMPIVMSSFVRFLKAEANLTVLSNPVAAKTEMFAGINESINKVITLIPGLPAPAANDVSGYIAFMDNAYNSNSGKELEIIMKEYYIAAWGNGIEVYNNYRRTGFPSNMQPTIELNAGDYYSTLYYPSDSQANNKNKPLNFRTRKVFWDINSPILH